MIFETSPIVNCKLSSAVSTSELAAVMLKYCQSVKLLQFKESGNPIEARVWLKIIEEAYIVFDSWISMNVFMCKLYKVIREEN